MVGVVRNRQKEKLAVGIICFKAKKRTSEIAIQKFLSVLRENYGDFPLICKAELECLTQ